jgi:hypothetical protein
MMQNNIPRRTTLLARLVPPLLLAGVLLPAVLSAESTSNAAPTLGEQQLRRQPPTSSLATKNTSRIPVDTTKPRIFVADTANNRIVSFNDMAGTGWATLTTVPASTPSTLSGPVGVAVPPGGQYAPPGQFSAGLYIADKMNARTLRVGDIGGGNGQVLSVVSPPPPTLPPRTLGVFTHGKIHVFTDGASSGGSRLLIADDMNGANTLIVTGAKIHSATHPTSGIGLLDGIAWDSHGKIYLSTSTSIVMLDSLAPEVVNSPAGAVGTECGANLPSPLASTNRGRRIAIGPDDKIYITDPAYAVSGRTSRGRIVRIDNMAGEGFRELPEACGRGFSDPSDIAVTADGIYVLDTRNNRLVRFTDMSGANCVEFKGAENSPFSVPSGLSVTRL